MAEPISLVSGLFTIAEAGFALSKTLYNVGEGILGARNDLKELSRELESLSRALISVGDVVKATNITNSVAEPPGPNFNGLVQVTERVLQDCETTFEKIQKIVRFPINVGDMQMSVFDRVRWSLVQKKKTARVKGALESSKASLVVMLQTLHLAVGMHSLRELQRISKGPEHLFEGDPQNGNENALVKEGYMSKEAELIVKDTISSIYSSEAQPALNLHAFRALEVEIKEIFAEYSDVSKAFKARMAKGKFWATLDYLNQSLPEVDLNVAADLLEEMQDLAGDLQQLVEIFVSQRGLLKQMVNVCDSVCEGQQLFEAKNRLEAVINLVEGCRLQVQELLGSCRNAIREIDFSINAKQEISQLRSPSARSLREKKFAAVLIIIIITQFPMTFALLNLVNSAGLPPMVLALIPFLSLCFFCWNWSLHRRLYSVFGREGIRLE